MGMLAYLISLAFDIYIGIIIVQILVSWLIIFDVINADHPQAKNLLTLLKRATDPVFVPLRKYIPPIGGIDITPIIIIMGLSFAKNLLLGALFSL